MDAAVGANIHRGAVISRQGTDAGAAAAGDDADVARADHGDIAHTLDRTDHHGRGRAVAGLDVDIAADVQADWTAVLVANIDGRRVGVCGAADAAIHLQVTGAVDVEGITAFIADAGAADASIAGVDGDRAAIDGLGAAALAEDSGVVG